MHSVHDVQFSASEARRDRPVLAGMAGAIGGSLIIVGTVLPWFSLYAGLHPLRGIMGLNGRLLLAGGAVAAMMGILLLFRDLRPVRLMLGGLGVGLALFAGWILLGVPATYRTLQENPMLVAQIGPGLFVALLGTLIVGGALLPQRLLRRSLR